MKKPGALVWPIKLSADCGGFGLSSTAFVEFRPLSRGFSVWVNPPDPNDWSGDERPLRKVGAGSQPLTWRVAASWLLAADDLSANRVGVNPTTIHHQGGDDWQGDLLALCWVDPEVEEAFSEQRDWLLRLGDRELYELHGTFGSLRGPDFLMGVRVLTHRAGGLRTDDGTILRTLLEQGELAKSLGISVHDQIAGLDDAALVTALDARYERGQRRVSPTHAESEVATDTRRAVAGPQRGGGDTVILTVPEMLSLPSLGDVSATGADEAFLRQYGEFLASLRLSDDEAAVAADYELAGGACELNDAALVGARLLAALLQPDDALCQRLVENALGVQTYSGPPDALGSLLAAQTEDLETVSGEHVLDSPYPRDWPSADDAVEILEAFLRFRESPVYRCFGRVRPNGSAIVSIKVLNGFPAFGEELEVWSVSDQWALVTSALWDTRVLPHALGYIRTHDLVSSLMSLLAFVSKDGNVWWDESTIIDAVVGLDAQGRALLKRFVSTGGERPWRTVR